MNNSLISFRKCLKISKKMASSLAFASKPSKIDDKSRRAQIFCEEKARQLRNLPEIKKIEVEIGGTFAGTSNSTRPLVLSMNSHVSTPFDCARHINETILKFGALATLDNKPWDMHRPIESLSEKSDLSEIGGYNKVKLKFRYFTDPDPWAVHSAYWRSCSLVLGAILESCFKEEYRVTLHSWPGSNYRTGSFVYDCKIDGLENWTPCQEELNIMSRTALSDLKERELRFEPLDVDISIAQEIFQDNPFKLEQIERIGKRTDSKNRIPLYRLGDFVDISKGPMISYSAQIGNYAITKIYPFESKDWGQLYRVQGVSLPFAQRVNSWTWEILTKSSKTKNEMPLPSRETWKKFDIEAQFKDKEWL